MQAGKLDRRITIQRKTETTSDSGEPIESWSNLVLRRAASMWPVRGDERFADPEKVATDQIEFRVRYSSDVAALSPLDRIIHPALDFGEDPDEAPVRHIHDVLLVQEIGRREGLKIITLRRADVLVNAVVPGASIRALISEVANFLGSMQQTHLSGSSISAVASFAGDIFSTPAGWDYDAEYLTSF